MGCRQSKNKEEKPVEETGGEGATDQQPEGKTEDAESAKLIVVFGATGSQGGSVARALHGQEDFKVRAVTRDPDSEKAKALSELGIEVVKGDFDDADSLKAALEGAYGVFGLTISANDEEGSENETKQGKALVDAAKEAGVQHFVYSGLEDTEDMIGKRCNQCSSKVAVAKYLKEQEVPHTILRLPAYFENLFHVPFVFGKKDDDEHVFGIPTGDSPLHMFCVGELGACVQAILKSPDEYKSESLGLSSDKLKAEEYAAILSKLLEKKVVATTMTPEDFAKSETPNAADLAVYFETIASEKYQQSHDTELTRKLHPAMPSFEQWAENNKEALIKQMNEE